MSDRGRRDEDFLDALSRSAPDGDPQSVDFELGAGTRQRAEAVKDEAADGVDAVGVEFRVEEFVDVFEPRGAIRQQRASP